MLLSDPRVAALAWGECGEPLVDLRERGLLVDDRLADPLGLHARLRLGLAERLVAAQHRLPPGLRLLVVEGYRPPALQRAYFDEYAGQVRAARPGLAEPEVLVEASRYVSPPAVAPHCTGAAVDLTLTGPDGELDLGTAVNASPLDSDGACVTAAPQVTGAPRRARDVLAAAMAAAGFVNYPTEWWHWSYGDRYWAATRRRTTTLYAPVDPADVTAGSSWVA